MFDKFREFEKQMERIALKEGYGWVPGMPDYFDNAKYLMPVVIELGKEVGTNKVVVWLPGSESNAFFLILGASGAGKTEALKVIGHGIAEHAIPVLVLDFHGDVCFSGLDSYLLSSGMESWKGINPMALDGHDGRRVGIYDRQMAVVEMVRRSVTTFSRLQCSILRRAVETAYSRAGIDDIGLLAPYARMPSFADVLGILRSWARDPEWKPFWPRINSCMAAVEAVFGHPVFNRMDNLTVGQILQRNNRLDLSQLADGMKFLIAETALRMVFNAVRLKGPVPTQGPGSEVPFRLFVLIDEAKIMSMSMDPDDPDCILNRLVTEGRKFGIGLVVASQLREHFGTALLGNASKRLVLRPMYLPEAKRNAGVVQVKAEELMTLRGGGEGYLSGNGTGAAQRIQVRRL